VTLASQYKTSGGVHVKEGDVVTTPTLMITEALDILMKKLAPAVDMSKIKAVSGSGQQHGSVYVHTDLYTLPHGKASSGQLVVVAWFHLLCLRALGWLWP
jgi:sugar (pentulose or hexulose) kinase